MKANVLAYLTNGNVVRMHVQHPDVGPCENGTHVGIFDHCCYRCAVDDWDDWYEDVAIYPTTKVACVYADGKCVWHNPAYIKDNTSIKKFQEGLYSESLDIDVDEEHVENMFDFNDNNPILNLNIKAMKVIKFYLGETPLGKGLAIIGFTDGHDEVLEVYLQNRMITVFKNRIYGPQQSISDVWTIESKQAEYIQCDEWDIYLENHNAETIIHLTK